MKKLIPILLLAAAGVAAFLYFRKPAEDPHRIRLSGNLEVTEVNAAFKMAGKVIEIVPREGDFVQKGQLLARLDTESLAFQKVRDEASVTSAQSALAQLKTDIDRQTEVFDRDIAMRRAELAQAEAMLRDLEAGSRSQEIAQAQAAVEDAKAQFDQAAADWERAQKLFKNEDISRVQYDQAQTRFRSTTAGLKNAQERLALVKEGPRKAAVDAARAQLKRAQEALRLSEANRKELIRKAQELTFRQADIERAKAQTSVTATQINDGEIRAPISGVVLSRPAEPGEVLAAGMPVLTLGDTERPWLRGYITESQLGVVKLGQKAKLRSDSFPGRTFDGVVTYIASEAEFTPKQIQTQEERVKLVYRIKIEVPNPVGELKNNMPMDAEIAVQ